MACWRCVPWFDPARCWDERPGGGGCADLGEAIGRLLGRAHVAAPAVHEAGLDAWLYTVDSNVKPLRRRCPPLDRAEVDRIIAATQAGREALTPLLEARRRAGYRRLCHGDLHLGNILLEDGRPVPFDCIEFSDVLGRMDIAYNAAFPIMDLAARSGGCEAPCSTPGWTRLRAALLDLWDGLALLPQFLYVRGLRARPMLRREQASARGLCAAVSGGGERVPRAGEAAADGGRRLFRVRKDGGGEAARGAGRGSGRPARSPAQRTSSASDCGAPARAKTLPAEAPTTPPPRG